MKGHGNWCGPGWTAGQHKDAKDLIDSDRIVPAIDDLDEACKQHDISLHDDPDNAEAHNAQLISKIKNMGIKGKLFALAVGMFGPSNPDNITPDKPPLKRHSSISPEGEPSSKKMKNIRRRFVDPPILAGQGDFGDETTAMDVEETGEETVNAAVAARSSAPAAAGRTGVGHGETAVSNIPVSLKIPFAKTVQQICSYYQVLNGTVGTGTAIAYQWRLNTPYDVYNNNAYASTEAPTPGSAPTADTSDATPQISSYHAYWMNFYKYYTVVNARYKIRFFCWPVTDATTRDSEMIAYFYHHGIQNPPLFRSGTNVVPHQQKRLHDGMYWVPFHYTPSTMGKSLYDQARVATGEYTPGSIVHEVGEDELQQVWHRYNEVPPTQERLTMHLQEGPMNASTETMNYKIEVTLEYTVQYKDLKVDFQYPTSLSDVPAISDFAGQT